MQFQEHLLGKALKRIIVPDSSYPNEGKIELRQRAVSYLESLGIGPVSEQIDPVSLHYQSLYFWWGFALKQLLTVSRDQRIEDGEYKVMREMFDEMPPNHRFVSLFVPVLIPLLVGTMSHTGIWVATSLLAKYYLPSKHTTLFQRQNDVVCLLGKRSKIEKAGPKCLKRILTHKSLSVRFFIVFGVDGFWL